MGMIQLPDALQLLIDQEVAAGHAASPLAFVESAITRLIEDRRSEIDDIHQAVTAGLIDAESSRYTTITTDEDRQCLQARLIKRLKDNLNADE